MIQKESMSLKYYIRTPLIYNLLHPKHSFKKMFQSENINKSKLIKLKILLQSNPFILQLQKKNLSLKRIFLPPNKKKH